MPLSYAQYARITFLQVCKLLSMQVCLKSMTQTCKENFILSYKGSVTIVINEKVGFFMNGQLISQTKKGNSWRVDTAYWNGLAVFQTQKCILRVNNKHATRLCFAFPIL